MAVSVEIERYKGIWSEEGLDTIANSEPIEIRVGVEANLKTWHVPKRLLTNSSTFFAAALDGGFAEQHSKTVILPEVVVDDFEVWIQWLYLGELSPFCRMALNYHKDVARLWSLGDMLGCPMFQAEWLAVLAKAMNDDDYAMRPEFLAFTWETCAHGSKLRKFVVDQLTYDVRMGYFKGNPESEEAYTKFAEDNEDFAREYTAASIRNGDSKESLQTLYRT